MPASELPMPAKSQPRKIIKFTKFYRGNIAKTTAYKWAREGRVKLIKIGGSTFTDETFDQFVRRQAGGGK